MMNFKLLIAGFVLFLAACTGQKTEVEISVVPKPAQLEQRDEVFKLKANTTISLSSTGENEKEIASFLKTQIKNSTDWDLEVITDAHPKRNTIQFVYCDENEMKADEAYKLTVEKKKVVIKANKPAGFFYAVQTLLQLMPTEFYQKDHFSQSDFIPVSGAEIVDYPRFGWRGYMLDASRHFQSVEFVKKMLDMMAMYKMNVFHWHLVDGHGWRLQIKKYPELTEIGAWRNQPGYDQGMYGGFYTQEQIKEVVEYARQRQITIVPEIEMPGHSVEVNAVFPQFSCTGKHAEVAWFYGFPPTEQKFPDCGPDALCAGNEDVYQFLENVLTEVLELFPSEFIHIGGDECNKTDWKACAKCQKKIKDEGLKDEHELQSYFIRRMEKFLNEKGRKLIGWDEILEGGLAPNAAVMSWRGEKGGITSAKAGHDVVMSPEQFLYLDHAQSEHPSHPKSWGNDISSLKEMYEYNPVPASLSAEEAKHIIGAQGNMWTIYANTEELVEIMSFPRILAISEATWTPLKQKSWDSFSERMGTHFTKFDYLGINYYREK